MTIAATRTPTRAVEPRTVAFWTMIVLTVFGLWMSRNLIPQMRAFPESAVIDIGFLIASLAFGMWLVRRVLRPVQAPSWSGTWLAVLWGGLAACGIALLLNETLMAAWSRALDLQTAATWSAALTAPINEELAKVAGVVLLTAVSTRLIRGAVDGFAYGALVGLGFQVFENLGYGLAQVTVAGGVDPSLATVQALGVRFVLTGLGSHWAMTAVAGAGIGYLVGAVGRPAASRMGVAAACVLLAMGMHWLFDSPVLEEFLQPIGQPLVNFAIAVIVYWVVRRRFRTRWRDVAEAEVAAGALEPEEARTLSRRHARKRYLRGFPAGARRRSAAGLQQTQLDLLEARVSGLSESAAGPWREAVAAARPARPTGGRHRLEPEALQ